MQFGMCLAVNYATTYPKSPFWKKGTRNGVLRFFVDSRSNVLRYQRPLHPCIFSHCKDTAHGYINRPFASASKLAAVSKYCSTISSRRHHKAQRAMFVFEYVRDARASRWAERRRRVNCQLKQNNFSRPAVGECITESA